MRKHAPHMLKMRVVDAPVVIYINDRGVDDDGPVSVRRGDVAPPVVTQVLVTRMCICECVCTSVLSRRVSGGTSLPDGLSSGHRRTIPAYGTGMSATD